MIQTTKYVNGFLFNFDLSQVVLIRKNRPEWQKGKLNGIGGHVEKYDEDSAAAMRREFYEEAGGAVPYWTYFCKMRGARKNKEKFEIDFFASSVVELSKIKQTTDEEIKIIKVKDIDKLKRQMIENLPWLIYSAIDVLEDGRPSLITVRYK